MITEKMTIDLNSFFDSFDCLGVRSSKDVQEIRL